MNVVLDLSRHCIETAARHEYRRLQAVVLDSSGPDDPRLQQRLALLADFLQRTDFRQLRAHHPELSGGKATHVMVQRASTGEIGWQVLEAVALRLE